MSSAHHEAESGPDCRSQRRMYCVCPSCWHLSLSQHNKHSSASTCMAARTDNSLKGWKVLLSFFRKDFCADLSSFCILWGGSSSSPALHWPTSTAPSSWSTRPCRQREALKGLNPSKERTFLDICLFAFLPRVRWEAPLSCPWCKYKSTAWSWLSQTDCKRGLVQWECNKIHQTKAHG